VEVLAKRPKRQRKENKFYTENCVVSGVSKHSRARRLSSQYCLAGIENDQQHFEEQHSGDLGEASDVSLLMNSSTMEELMSHLTSSPCSSNDRLEVPVSPTSFLAAAGMDQDQLLAKVSETDADPTAEAKTAVRQTSEIAITINHREEELVESSVAELSASPKQNLEIPVNHHEEELVESSVAELSASPKQNLEIPVKHHEEELVESLAAELSASPKQNLEIPVNHREEEPDEQRTAFDNKVQFRELEERKTATRKRKRNPQQWKRNIRKVKKAKGEEHVNSTGKPVPAKEVLHVNCNCRFKCTESFNDENRRSICAEYHALADYDRQKDYILRNIVIRQVQSRKVLSRDNGGKEEYSQSRQVSITYYLEHLGSRRRVCKGFFMKTLCLSNRSIMTAVEGRSTSGVFAKTDGRGRQPSVNKTDNEHRQAVKDHIQLFPTVESHYCRKDSQRLYLDSRLTIARMYELYLENCANKYGEAYKPVSSGIYRKIFTEEFNLGFYKPKKDQCSECTKYELMTAADKEGYKSQIEEHWERHKEAQTAKDNDKQHSVDDKTFKSVSFDLQSVLQVPSSDASQMYYKRKLCCYNFTIYEQAQPHDAHCYLWSEVDGRRGSNEIGSCLLQYLQSLPKSVEQISMFSDTCGGQNRNQNIMAMLFYAVHSIDHLTTIEQKFLEKGHSYMECDSMHSAIDYARKNTSVFSVSSWKSIFEIARRKNPYKVHQLNHTQFKDCKALCDSLVKNRTKDENGDTVNWMKIKVFRFEKNNHKVQYKYRYGDDFKSINIFGRGRPPVINLPEFGNCYNSRLAISHAKKIDLLSLCKSGIIPKEHQDFFRNLPSSKKKNINCDDCD